MFIGQSADAGFTPLNGFLSDRSEGWRLLGMGRRKWFHFLGSLMVLVNFFLVFGICLPIVIAGPDVSTTVLIAYYSVTAALFNAGWSAVQVSHMSLVPELTTDETERVILNSARYFFTVAANILVFIVLWVFIHVSKFTPERQFTALAIFCMAVGTLANLFFQYGTKELVQALTTRRIR